MAVESSRSWLEPGAWLVAPGVYRIPLPLPMERLRAVNVYVIESDNGLVMIDGGWALAESRAALDAALQSIDRRATEIERIFVTHIHRDHYTQAVRLSRDVGAHVLLSGRERRSLKALNDLNANDPQIEMLEEAGAPMLARHWRDVVQNRARDLSMWGDPDEWLLSEARIDVGSRVLEVLETPGHTQGHLVFVDRDNGLIFSGDHVLPTITPSIGYEPVVTPLPLADYLASLARVRGLPDLILLPAHGPAGASLHARVDELAAHHATRLAGCREATSGKPKTAHEVAMRLLWTRRLHAFGELDSYDAALGVLEARAHLEVLCARGQLRRRREDDHVVYEALD